MLIDFFYTLRAAKLPVSVREYLTAPPQAVGSIVAGEVYSDEVVCDANLGYLVTAVVS
jgi:hypothetical protein